jgi:hypothetical protein
LRDLPILQKLLEQARRRVLTQLVLEKGIVALIVALSGAIVLLLAGTQILDWYWIALLAAVSLGAGLYQLRGRIPGLYNVAQRIDRKLGLADALSTAFHFARNPDPYRQTICERQARDANETARGVEVRVAVPYSRPKYLAPAAVLLVAAMGLFAVRYLVTGSLSLEPSLVKIALDSFFGGSPKLAKNVTKQGGFKPEPFDPGAPDAAAKGEDKKNDEDPNNAIDQPDNAGDDAQAGGDQKQDGTTPGQDSAKGDENQQGADKQSDQQNKPQDSNQQGKQDNNQNGKQGQDKQSSMFDKLRDALSNMMKGSKSNDSQQQSSKQNGKQDSQQSESQDGQQQGQSQGEQQQQASSGSQQTGEGKQDQNGSDAKSDQRAGEKASQDAKNGIGSADGDKKAREAAMLEAMGKIEEILGKRQQNVSGEMIEVGSTKQQLKTPFLQKQGEHAEAGGEIHRDEVPPMYQQFVEQYFEEIRKPAQGAAAAPAKGAGAGKAGAKGTGPVAPVAVPGVAGPVDSPAAPTVATPVRN